MDLKAWIELFFSVVLSGTTLYVAWKQYALEQRREAERRWERQLSVCEDVYRFLDSTSQAGLPQLEPLATLMRVTEPMNLSFLFDERDARYLDEIRQRAHRLQGRSHVMDATARLNVSEGFIHPSVCRGRALSCLATAPRSARV
jgi:hypothetical protein